jgi:hypothetical protein
VEQEYGRLFKKAIQAKIEGGKAKMLQHRGVPIIKFWRLKGIAKKVRAGIIPEGVSENDIWESLRITKPRAMVELFGALYRQVMTPEGDLKEANRLVSLREVSAAFAKQMVDCMLSSGAVTLMHHFLYHKQGAGSAAETDTDTDLGTKQTGATSGTCTHGASSQIYQTVGTITAGSAYGCREHGIFSASTGGILLDRSVVTNIDLNADDVVTWTYNLTINAGG